MGKNYLFAPFKDDDDKISEFDAVVNALKYVLADTCPSLTDTEKKHYMESALHGLRVFIGRLESYYDVIISDLQAESIEQIKDNKRLKAENVVAIADERVIKGLEDKVRELKAENVELKTLCDKLKNTMKVNEDAHFRELEECSHYHNSIKAENDSLQDQLKDAVNDYESLLNSNSVK